MVRLLMAGFETGDTLAYGADLIGSSAGTVALVTSTPAARSGSYCLKTTMGAAGSSNAAWLNYRGAKHFAHAAKTEVWYAFGFFAHHAVEAGTPPAGALCVVRDTTNNINTYLALDNGTLRAYVVTAGGGGSGSGTTSSLLGAASSSMSSDAWHLIELHLIASTTTGGTCEVYQDGSLVITATGTRTCQTNANCGSVELCLTHVSTTALPGSSGSYHAFDDLRVNDTSGSVNTGRPGDGSIRALIPNGVGTTIGGTPLTGTPSSTNWQNVDDIPPTATDYNAGTSVGTGETYTLTDPSGSGSAQAVNVLAYTLNADNGGGSVGITVKTAAGTSEGTAQPITATATYYSRVLDTDPSDSGAWSATKLAALEAGITIR
jgi:hypothetical protein